MKSLLVIFFLYLSMGSFAIAAARDGKDSYSEGSFAASKGKPSLCIFAFQVVDSKTGAAIENYTCKFPETQFSPDLHPDALPRNMTLFRDGNRAVFSCVSDTLIWIIISAPGYPSMPLLLSPVTYKEYTGAFDFKKVSLDTLRPLGS